MKGSGGGYLNIEREREREGERERERQREREERECNETMIPEMEAVPRNTRFYSEIT